MDFFTISTRSKSRGGLEIYPKFIIKKSNDLMIRGGDFYAVWVEDKGLWSTSEDDCFGLIDKALDEYYQSHDFENARVLHMWDAETGMVDAWHKYCQKQMRDNFHNLDETLVFSNTPVNKKDYASKRLPYPLEAGPIDAYESIISVLYSPEERHKIEWAIGAIVSGDSKSLQKFMVFYGAGGTGKSTILNIFEMLFEGYFCVFNSQALGSSNSSFALEPFKNNPLVAIQHDGDLSRIEDNTRINSLVSHELMTVNNKFEKLYANRFKCFIIMGTNKPVRITDAKSGLIRRLIDVTPTGNLVNKRDYNKAVGKDGHSGLVKFELGAIAQHCLEVYQADPKAYDNYIPLSMMGATNDFYNFIVDSYTTFKNEDCTTLNAAWALYNAYCEDARVPFPLPRIKFKEELKNYFQEFKERTTLEDGTRVRNFYSGFKDDIFDKDKKEIVTVEDPSGQSGYTSLLCEFDTVFRDCPAQYAGKDGYPIKKWENVKTTLSDLDTSKLHYVLPSKVPNFICIDFDLKDENGKKSRVRNLEAASHFPPTYGEYSKSGEGIHLCYIYDGDVSKLSPLYDTDIEIKVFTGNSSLRRMFSYSNGLPIAHIKSGLPTKGEKRMVNANVVQTEKGLRTTIKKCLNKEIHGATKPEIDFIFKILEDAYNSDLKYDVSDMYNAVLAFATKSSHQADICVKTVSKMHFKSEDMPDNLDVAIDNMVKAASDDPNIRVENISPIIFYDVEVFPNLFIVNWKYQGKDKQVVRMINPTPTQIEELMRNRLIGFNNRRYDNHILYARMMGYSNEQLFKLSSRIVGGDRNAFFGEAYNISYTDIYDYASKKQSLKKWEIELGIHHQELGLPWDQPVPEELWTKVAEYCDNDVLATEAVFEATQEDFAARQMLADIAGMTVNDTTNSLTTRIIFGKERKPQGAFNYRNMGDMSEEAKDGSTVTMPNGQTMLVSSYGNTRFDKYGRPLFPGYIFDHGKSSYWDVEEVGEGGYVYAKPDIYGNVALLDIASMHPSSIIAEQLFGEYTKNFEDLVKARLCIKHKDYDTAKTLLDGKLAPYLKDKSAAKKLSKVLKIPINSVYGLTDAGFENPFRDPRNIDNIVAKRGALFMINLRHEVESRGFTVAHIKTDSIKIPDATLDIINFVYEYGKMYGYTFEHEATYDKMCLVNNAVYIAKYATMDKCRELYGDAYVDSSPDVCSTNRDHEGQWTATGTQFQVPYVFKTLFTHEPIIFSDMCETKSVTSGNIYLDMNEDKPDVSEQEALRKYLDSSDFQKVGQLDSKGRVIKHPVKYRDIDFNTLDVAELDKQIASGHDYIFVGRVGLFCPILPGYGGGLLMREKDGKYYAVTGSSGYRWLESEQVTALGKQDCIDTSYYEELCKDAIESIHKYGDFEWFASDEPYDKFDNGIWPF